ncbi:YdcF family protein [Bradyrhizobium sp.]|uniref:YdcF family protein n=1 Tax=Bradyrhizobium sp. TaxID=376 RepID=UPI002DDDB497|nr:YdcF family protein [Bradyrhizobium sp.]HEV2154826.1 YdcF family protein [Bradyrhizobium sp.]
MFFVLSKTLGVMVLPQNFLIGLTVLGSLLLLTRFFRLGRALVLLSALMLAVCGFGPVGNLLLYPLESRFPAWTPSQGAPDGIVVLGASIDLNMSAAHGTPVVSTSSDRILMTAALARKYPKARVIYTGGSPNLISDDAKEADFAAGLFEGLGVDKSRLILEGRSRNTYENALFSKAMVDPKPGERWLLVTSAYHMPRSIGLFRKVGFAVEPCPVDWRVGTGRDVFSFTDAAEDGLSRTNLAVREWLGLITYRAVGRIDELLPGPQG